MIRTQAYTLLAEGGALTFDELQALLRAETASRNWTVALRIHKELEDHPDYHPSRLSTRTREAVVKALIGAGAVASALHSLRHLTKSTTPKPRPSTFYQVMAAVSLEQKPKAVLSLFSSMIANDIVPNPHSVGVLQHVSPDTATTKAILANGGHKARTDLSSSDTLATRVYLSAKEGSVIESIDYLQELVALGGSHTTLVAAYTTVIDAIFHKEFTPKRTLKMVEQLVEDMKSSKLRLSLRTYTVLIHGFLRFGVVHAALRYVEEVHANGIKMDLTLYNVLIAHFGSRKDIAQMQSTFQNLVSAGLTPNNHVLTSMVAGFAASGQLEEMEHFLADAHIYGLIPDLPAYNAAMYGHGKVANIPAMLELFQNLPKNGCVPDAVTYTILLQWLSRAMKVDMAEMHQRIFTTEVSPDAHAYSLLAHHFVERGEVDRAHHLLDSLTESETPVETTFVTSLLTAHSKRGNHALVADYFRKLFANSEMMDKYLYHVLMTVCLQTNRPRDVIELWNLMLENRVPVDGLIVDSLITACCRLTDVACLEDAFELLERRAHPINSATYDAVINGFGIVATPPAQDAAFHIYRQMLSRKFKPSLTSIQTIMDICLSRRNMSSLIWVLSDTYKLFPSIVAEVDRSKVYRAIARLQEWDVLTQFISLVLKANIADDVAELVSVLVANGHHQIALQVWEQFAECRTVRINDATVRSVLDTFVYQPGTAATYSSTSNASYPIARRVWQRIVERSYPALSPVISFDVGAALIKSLSYWNHTDEFVTFTTSTLQRLHLGSTVTKRLVAYTLDMMRQKRFGGMAEVKQFWDAKSGRAGKA
ncbi:hypothetical protein DFS34DRAFT_644792 [Phlyctochytrium arcticum]|nr:hypothetical protein DFS34DRAFT_644792 [Phlyctochytrium arcticum]